MNRMLRVEVTEEERQELDHYLTNYPHGQLSHILRCAIRNFITEEREKLAQKEAQSGYQGRKRLRTKAT